MRGLGMGSVAPVREAAVLYRIIINDRPVLVTFAVLVAITLCLILAYGIGGLFRERSAFAEFLFEEIALTKDRSMGEIFNYGLSFLSASLFFVTFVALRSLMFLFSSLLMAFIWFDDSARYHERLGHKLADRLDLPAVANVRPQEVGELLAWGVAGVVLALLLVLAVVRRGPGDLGALFLLSVCFGLLVVFGLLADIVGAPEGHRRLFGLMEDGGEMLAIVLVTGMSLGLVRNAEAYRAACGRPHPAQPVAADHRHHQGAARTAAGQSAASDNSGMSSRLR